MPTVDPRRMVWASDMHELRPGHWICDVEAPFSSKATSIHKSKVPAVMVVVVAAVLLPSSSCSVKLVSLKGIRKGEGISTDYYTPKIPTEGTPHENSCRRNTICTKHWFKKKMEGIICQGQGDIRFFCLQKL